MHSHKEKKHHRTERDLIIVLCISSAFFFMELFGGLWSNSLALLSDAGHLFSDIFAVGLILGAIRWSVRPANTRKTFGYYRVEILATLINGGLLLFVALQIVLEAIHRFSSPKEVDLPIMMSIAVLGLVANIVSAYFLGHHKDHLATKSAFFHVMGDLISSVGVILAGFLIYLTGWIYFDSIVSILIALLLVVGAYKLLRESVDILMEGAPAHLSLEEIRKTILSIQGVEDIHDLHVWVLGSDVLAASAHLHVLPMSTQESEKITREITRSLQETYGIRHTTFQVENLPKPIDVV